MEQTDMQEFWMNLTMGILTLSVLIAGVNLVWASIKDRRKILRKKDSQADKHSV